jgi:hypothetical protein
MGVSPGTIEPENTCVADVVGVPVGVGVVGVESHAATVINPADTKTKAQNRLISLTIRILARCFLTPVRPFRP